MPLLLTSADLPDDFVYPSAFVRVVEHGLLDLEPWEILEGPRLLQRLQGLRSRYPERRYIPFARRTDNDDVACWDLDELVDLVVVVHDFASVGWERQGSFEDVHAWLRQAFEDFVEWGEIEGQQSRR